MALSLSLTSHSVFELSSFNQRTFRRIKLYSSSSRICSSRNPSFQRIRAVRENTVPSTEEREIPVINGVDSLKLNGNGNGNGNGSIESYLSGNGGVKGSENGAVNGGLVKFVDGDNMAAVKSVVEEDSGAKVEEVVADRLLVIANLLASQLTHFPIQFIFQYNSKTQKNSNTKKLHFSAIKKPHSLHHPLFFIITKNKNLKMAVELYTESPSSREMSPRISFSHDLKNSEIVPIEPLKSSLLDYDFDFCVTRKSSDQEPTLADELFANGIILPIQIKKKNIPTILKSKSFSPSSSSSSSSLYSAFLPPLPPSSVLNNGGESEKETEEKQSNNNNSGKSTFWTFKRSKSLNCGSIYKRGLCPLPLLSRSKSTGSSTSAKRSLISKEEKQCYLKNSSSSNHQKPPLKKNFGGSSFNSGVIHVSPVLNVPTGKVFGLGSIFSTGKDRSKKK